MATNEELHEITCSRLMTAKLRADLYDKQSKNYGSNTTFGGRYIKQLVLPFAEALEAATSKRRRGKATSSALALGYKPMQELFLFVGLNEVAYISLNKIFDEYYVSAFNQPVTVKSANRIGKCLEVEQRHQVYLQAAPEGVSAAVHKQLNTPGSYPSYRRRGAKAVAEKLLVNEYGWDPSQLPQDWSNQTRVAVGLFILDVATAFGILQKKLKRQGRKTIGVYEFSDQLKAYAIDHQQDLEELSIFKHPLIEPPRDWVLEPGPARNNISGGYHIPAFKRDFKLQGRVHSDTIFGKDALTLLNTLGRTAWNIDPDVYEWARKIWDKALTTPGFDIKPFSTVFYNPILDERMPENIVEQGKESKAYKDWKSEKRLAHELHQDAQHKSASSRKALCHAEDYIKETRFYLSWSCDYRGRIYSQQSFFDQQKNDFQRSLVTFADGCRLDDSGFEWASKAIATAYKGSKWTYDQRLLWTKNNTDLIKRIADHPIEAVKIWEEADDPWQFLQLCLEWNAVVITKEKKLWDAPIGVDATASGLQLLSAMRRDPIGMKYSNLLKPESASEPPQDAYKEVMKVARQMAYKNPETARLADHLEDRSLGKVILMTRIYGSTDWKNKYKIKDHFIKEGTFGKEIQWEDVEQIYKLIDRASEQLFPMAFEALRFIKKLGDQVEKNKGKSFTWKTPTGDSIHINKVSQATTVIKTSEMGEKTIPLDQVSAPKMSQMKGSLAPDFVHSYDAAVLKSSFVDWHKPLAVIHDCIKVLPNDMDHAIERIRNGFRKVCDGDPLARFADDLGVSAEQLPRLKQGTANLDEVLASTYMFN